MTSWNERRAVSAAPRAESRQIPWRLFALEVLLVLAVVGAFWFVSAMT
jgi:hypothetical protein